MMFARFAVLIFAAPLAAAAEPHLYILGVAQDAGYPQAGCYREHCMPGWKDRDRRISATAIAYVDTAAGSTVLFEATPNLPDQLYRLHQHSGGAELAGVFLTHAHIGHYAGLMFFGFEAMGADAIAVYAMPRMKRYLETNGPWSQLVKFGNIVIHRTALFLPDINAWDPWEEDVEAIVRRVDYALVDATFFADGELPGRDMSAVPHPRVIDTMARFADAPAAIRSRIWFIHMNHTNPLLDPASPESRRVTEAGFNVAREGLRLPM